MSSQNEHFNDIYEDEYLQDDKMNNMKINLTEDKIFKKRKSKE